MIIRPINKTIVQLYILLITSQSLSNCATFMLRSNLVFRFRDRQILLQLRPVAVLYPRQTGS